MLSFKAAWFMPVLVLPSWNAWAHQFWLFVFMPKARKDDAALLAHELWHVKQDIATAFLGPVLRALSPQFKLRCESAAYGEAARKGHEIEPRAWALKDHYGGNITLSEARAMIEDCKASGALILSRKRYREIAG